MTQYIPLTASADFLRRNPPAPPPAPARPAPTWESLERQDWHLWILAGILLLVLGGSLVAFMFPAAFWFAQELPLRAAPRAVGGFCVLMLLAFAYMVQRQTTVRSLRRQLYVALMAAAETERQRFESVVETLPGLSQFRDSLAMEYRRASTSGAPLSVALLDLPCSTAEERGRAAEMIRYLLRSGEGLFSLPGELFGLILPNMAVHHANGFASQAVVKLTAAFPALQVNTTVNTYPDQAGSLSELESVLRSRIQ
jgi:GGDEF domain-containing protein